MLGKENQDDQQPNFTIRLGTKVKSVSSGFQGVVTSRTQYLHGCNRYGVQPGVDKDGKMQENWYFDEADLEIQASEPMLARANNDRGGPPSKAP